MPSRPERTSVVCPLLTHTHTAYQGPDFSVRPGSYHGEHMFGAESLSRRKPEDLPLEHLEQGITQLASHICAGTCRWLELVAEFDRREAAGSWGCRSTAEWISWRCAVAPRTAREHVRVARALGELPRIREGFSRGTLSYAKVKALTRVADSDSEEDLLELARYATASQLERMLRAYRRVGANEARDTHEGEYLAWSWEEDGSLRVRGRLAAEDGALLLRALEAARDRLSRHGDDDGGSENGEEGGPAGPPPASSRLPRITNVEALVEMADVSLSARSEGRSAAERYQVVIHVDHATLAATRTGAPSSRASQLSRPRRRGGWHVTLPWSRCLKETALRYESGARAGRSRPRSGGRFAPEMAAAGSQVASAVDSSMPTTSDTGRRAAGPIKTICSCSVDIIIGSFTRGVSRSSPWRTAASDSGFPTAPRSGPRRRRGVTSRGCLVPSQARS